MEKDKEELRQELIDRLSPKERRFVEEYMIDVNNTQAAIRAGYSPKTAYTQGCFLLKRLRVRMYLQFLQAEQSAITGISSERVIRELASVAFANPFDVFKDGKVNSNSNSAKAVSSVKKKEYFDKEGKPVEETEVRFTDKNKALELLGKHLGVFNEKLDLTIDQRPAIVNDLLKGDN